MGEIKDAMPKKHEPKKREIKDAMPKKQTQNDDKRKDSPYFQKFKAKEREA
jgi:hypothetical protein